MSDTYSYIVRGAKMACDCGSHSRKINLPQSHGSYVNGKPVMNKSDNKFGENISYFGICNNPNNPNTQTIYLITEKGENISGKPCCPNILKEWIKTKDDTIVEGKPALITKSELICAYKGKIIFVSDGQEETSEE